MTEVLSQSEIDALLNALDSGEVDAHEFREDSEGKKVKPYDFRNPQKMSKDQLRTLEIIHENFGRLLQTFFSGYLRTAVKITVLTVDQYGYSEFSNAISNPAFLTVFKIDPLPGECIMDISSKIAFAIIDRLLGGDGENEFVSRPFTEIERILLKKVIKKVLKLFQQAWENIYLFEPEVQKIETNPQFAQIVSPNETIALVTMNVTIGEMEGMINLCIPHLVIESIMEKLTTKSWFSSRSTNQQKYGNEIMKKRLKHTKVPVIANFSSTMVTVGDILNIQVGDVIKLDNYNGEDIKINIGNSLKFIGSPGSINNKMAVKITNVKKDGDEADDE
ncbi:flagellar motor switch protein FliM [Abyssisolibacter fermentans]|uniref:flagellar motor switch protein FliM n=1 Tax=Abyssisolibacter fermentans TaxID=1766203 RepID=UPI00082E1C3A|nr:flagellar motor switch protein FliM [Abyssisolibacter fermentans]